MNPNEPNGDGRSRRAVLGGLGGAGLASLTDFPVASAGDVDALEDLETDPHTRETFRSIVDAIVPRTPELAGERGPEHEPGALAVDLEAFLIWNYDNAEELRAEGLSWLVAAALSIDLDAGDFDDLIAAVRDDHSPRERYRLEAAGLTAVETAFGALRAVAIDVDYAGEDDGTIDVAYVLETAETTVSGESDTYPYAPVFAAIFDVVALEFVARGKPDDDVEPNATFDGGGAFTWFSRRDRLRCLQWLYGGAPVEILADELGVFIAAPETMPGVVQTLHILTAMGYYSEWAGYGETKTDPPTERVLETPVDEVQSRLQTGYPGPAPGYAGFRGFEVNEFRENDY